MRDLGWQEGKDVEYRFLYADGNVDHLDAMAGELVRQTVDIIVVNNALTTHAAQQATKTIPIVMTGVSSPVSRECQKFCV
jgi:putative ABC transport system substrate-binding protein